MSSHLAPCVLPYDSRLAKASRGTRRDFAQRALLHYVSCIYKVDSPNLENDREAVQRAFQGIALPQPRPMRDKVEDEAIRRRIATLLPTVGARKIKMLQHLRFNDNVACEQSRFARLFDEVLNA
jgi:hypothetical protein